MNKNQGAVWHELKTIKIEERPYPQLESDSVIIEIAYVGVCGSDLHFFTDGRIGSGILTEPRIFGHELSGIIKEVGSSVNHLSVGDRVVVDPGQSCGQCSNCQTGRYNLCEEAAWNFLGTSKKDGGLQKFLAYSANRVYRLPDETSLKTAALLEPYSVATHAVNRMGVQGGGYTVISGAGCIGLMTLFSIKRHFNTKVIMIDVVDKRLQKALDLGADFVINSAKEDPIAKVMELTNDQGADFIYESAGVPVTVTMTADLAKRGAKIVFIGTTVDTHVNMHFNAIMRKELDISTVFRYAGELRKAIDELAQENFELETIVTDEYDFLDVQEAYMNNIENKQDVVKTMIKVGSIEN